MGSSISVQEEAFEVLHSVTPPAWIYDVLRFCGWKERFAVAMLLSKSWHSFFMDDSFFWRWMCERLAEEKGLYLPDTGQGLPGPCPSWGHLFRDLWTDVNRAKAFPSVKGRERYSLQVCARFRPDRAGAAQARQGSQVVLPLHQKIQLAKARRGGAGRCTTSQALRDVWADARVASSNNSSRDVRNGTHDLDGGGGVDPWASAFLPAAADEPQQGPSDVGGGDDHAVGDGDGSQPGQGGSNKDVAHSPADDRDKSASHRGADTQGTAAGGAADEVASMGHFHACVLSVDEASGAVLTVTPGCGLREFVFDRVFGDRSTQADVYQQSARRVVMDFVNGNSGSLLVYGQTGSGKTHTIFGPDAAFASISTYSQGWASSCQAGRDTEGIVPRACREVLSVLDARKAAGTLAHATLTVSYIEIYGNEVSDLLRGGMPVGQSRVAGQRYVLDGHIATEVKDLAQVEEILRVGDQQKRRAATAMNERSTRAHTVFMLRLVQDAGWQREWAAMAQDVIAVEGGSGDGGSTRGGSSPVDLALAAAGAHGGDELTSTLMLVDLGGAEQMKKSLADAGTIGAGAATWQDYYARRQRLQEAQYINSGLFALKKCIDALNARAQKARRGRAEANTAKGKDKANSQAVERSRGGRDRNMLPAFDAVAELFSATHVSCDSSAAPAGALTPEEPWVADAQYHAGTRINGALDSPGDASGENLEENGEVEAGEEAEDPFVWRRPDVAILKPSQESALTYVPYQDSKLTMLLSTSLSGECRSVVLVTASLMQCNAGETVQALRFGERCSSVKHVGADGRAAMEAMTGLLRGLAAKIAECEHEIKSKERWETVRARRFDEVSGEWEVVSTSMLVGAEKEREQLEALLMRRRELLGIE